MLAQRKNGHNSAGCGSGNGIGVDLNRNYDAMWVASDAMIGASNSCQHFTYKGIAPQSEPESKAHSDYILNIKPKAYLTIHAFARVVLFPYTYARNAARPHNYEELMTVSAEIIKRIGPGWKFGQGE